MRNSIRILFFFLLIASDLTACTKRTTAPDEIVVGIETEPVTLDPRFATDAISERISHLIFNGLVQVGARFEAAPDAAQSWSYRNNTYTLELAPGLRFHNGRPVNADDLIFSFEQFRSSSSPFASDFEEVKSFHAAPAGDHIEVKIKMKRFVANYLTSHLPSLKILPKNEIGGFPDHLIGTGSFQLESKGDSDVVLKAVKNHALATPKIERVDFKVVHDDFTRFQKMMKGELDVVFNDISNDKIHNFEENPARFNVYHFPSASMAYLLVNMKDKVLMNREIRHALSQSINRAEIIRYKLAGMAEETTSILPKQHPDFNTEIENPPYDPAAAKKTVERLELTGHHLILKCSNTPDAMDHAKVIAYQLSQSGLDVELETFEWGKFYDDIKKGNFQLAISKWVGISDPDIYRVVFNSKEKPPGGRNRGSYFNPIIDELTERAQTVENEVARRGMYHEIQKIILDDDGFIPLWNDQQVVVTKKNIIGFEPSISGDFQTLIKMNKTHPIDSKLDTAVTTN